MEAEGLRRDLDEVRHRLSTRRRLLSWLITTGATPIVGCDGQAWGIAEHPDASPNPDAGSTADASDADAPQAWCSATPAETGGPFPADSRIGPNVLVQNGIVRSDIRSSFALGSATAGGVDLVITLTVVDRTTCRPRPDTVVYLWHCDREGRYSLYSPGVTDQDYLRGAQQADAEGQVTFTTIFPGCYPGRWPHMHFEVFADLQAATSSDSTPVFTSQLAFVEHDCRAAYDVSGYEASRSNLQVLSLQTDGVFRDGFDLQLATVTGSAGSALRATFLVAI